jgi:CDP-diacylglycerol--glycerol-3-phosphate 3-phosphatidyltransferase
MDILTACPKANGFFTAKGISGYIPNAYDALEQSFFKQIVARNLEQNVRIFEYNRSKWTFHAKGLWLHDKDGLPICTLIGSSNFGQRSEDRDTEAQIMILTQDEKLREKMEQERSRLFLTSQQASSNVFAQPDRKVNVVVRLIVKWFKNYL